MTAETDQPSATRKTPPTNQTLAARARDLAARAGLESDDPHSAKRKAALCAAVLLGTTTSVTAARKCLGQIENALLRQAASDVIDQLAHKGETE